jgi:hypothetical protein
MIIRIDFKKQIALAADYRLLTTDSFYLSLGNINNNAYTCGLCLL